MRSLLPEYQTPFGTLFRKAVRAMMSAHAPLLADIRSSSADHLADESIVGSHGLVMGVTEMSAHMEVQTEAIIRTNLDVWYYQLWSAAEQFAGHQMLYLLASVKASTQLTGNTVNLQGAPISYDAVLDMLERIEFEVGENGEPDGLTMVVAPATADQIAKLGPMTSEQEERYQRIIAEKRRAQDAKKRVRRLDQRPG